MRLSIFFAITFLLPFFTSAQIVINEVQISPIDGRFIELHNSGDLDVDLTDWYVQRKTATGASFSSLVTKTYFEGKSLKRGGYFLISRKPLANSDIVLDTLTLTESNTIRLRNKIGEDVDLIEWGSIAEGESYQRNSSGQWGHGAPSPGGINNLSVATEATPSEELENSSEGDGDSTESQEIMTMGDSGAQASSGGVWPVEPQIYTRIKKSTEVGIVGADILFSGETLGLEKKPLTPDRYLWSFGDGGSKEGEKVYHHYSYPGKYVVILNTASGKYSASDRTLIDVVPADISISSFGDGSFIEIFNKTNVELNLSQWSISIGDKKFYIPDDTILLKNSKTRFPYSITQIYVIYNNEVKLLYPNGAVATSYVFLPGQISNAITQTTNAINKPTDNKVKAPLIIAGTQKHASTTALSSDENTEENIFNNQDNQANVFDTNIAKMEEGLYFWFLALALIIILGIGGVYFSKKDAIRSASTNSGFFKNSRNKKEPAQHSSKAEADKYEIIEDKY